MKRICVYCASSMGNKPEYAQAATLLGATIARSGHELVYGGGSIGLMGTVANAALQAGGKVIGVIPNDLNQSEIGHSGLTTLHEVKDMHERKALMAKLADAFIALPGGYGTLEELSEMLTWAQLKYHTKPIALLNIAGYYDHLLKFLDHAQAEGLIKPKYRQLIIPATDPVQLVATLFEPREIAQ